MSTHKPVAAVALACLLAGCATQSTGPKQTPPGPGLGRAASPVEVAAVDISIPPSGAGLPAGTGSVKQGAAVYAAKCQSCHGDKGAGKPADQLAGGRGTLGSSNPVRTVGSYWPHATTLFDYIRRSMPTTAPLSLSSDEVYAVTAYVLSLDGIVGGDAVMNASTLPAVRMPNRDGFIDYSKK